MLSQCSFTLNKAHVIYQKSLHHLNGAGYEGVLMAKVFSNLGGLLVKNINEILGLSVKTVEIGKGAHSPRFKSLAM